MLLCEEMRRVAEYFIWKRDDWLRLRGLRPEAHDGVQDGCNAYVSRQAKMWEGLTRRCVRKWLGPLEVMTLKVAWSAKVRSAAGLLPLPPSSTHARPPFVAPVAPPHDGINTSSTPSTTTVNPSGESAPLSTSSTPPLPALPLPNTGERTFLEQLLAEDEEEDIEETWEDQEVVDDGHIIDSDGADND